MHDAPDALCAAFDAAKLQLGNGPSVPQEDKAKQERSDARRVLHAMVHHVRSGATYDQARAALLDDPETSNWTGKRSIPNQDQELRRMWDRAVARYSGGRTGRPLIRITANNLAGMTDMAEEALLAAGLGLYQQGEFIVRTGIVRINVADDRTTMGQRVLQLSEFGLAEAMDIAANWEKYDLRSNDWVSADPSTKVVSIYMDRVGRWRLPVLTGIINAPTLRPDGSILATPGYDPATGLLFDPCGATFPPIPEQPTQLQACEALGVLYDLIADFPFIGDADRSVAPC
jgi:hypothetical protein